jgi:hypothetical protein
MAATLLAEAVHPVAVVCAVVTATTQRAPCAAP